MIVEFTIRNGSHQLRRDRTHDRWLPWPIDARPAGRKRACVSSAIGGCSTSRCAVGPPARTGTTSITHRAHPAGPHARRAGSVTPFEAESRRGVSIGLLG